MTRMPRAKNKTTPIKKFVFLMPLLFIFHLLDGVNPPFLRFKRFKNGQTGKNKGF